MNIEPMLDNLSAKVPHAESEYMGEDGLLHCSVCHRNVQTEIEVFGKKKIVRCICQCKVDQMNAEKERAKREEHERRRRTCFAGTKLSGWTFENDDRKYPQISDAMKRYVDNFSDFLKEGKGLLIHSTTTGTGKTHYAAAIANALIDKGYRVIFRDITWFSNEVRGTWDKNEVVDEMNEYALVVLDDFGASSDSEYGREIIYNIINSRYLSGLPFILTTNLDIEQIKKPKDVQHSRIYDRILERCFPVEVPGSSRRRQTVKDTYFDIKDRLGL